MKEIKVVSKVIVEVVGKPKEHVDKVINEIVKNVEAKDDIKLLTSKIFEPASVENDLFSGFCELEIETPNLRRLMEFSFDFMPSSIEILEPKEVLFDTVDIQDLMNDLLARLHQYATVIKTLHSQNAMYKKKLDG